MRTWMLGAFAVLLSLATLRAQVPVELPPPLAGNYDLTKTDGTKVGSTKITANAGTNTLNGKVYDKNGKEIPAEELTFTPCPCGGDHYNWVNVRGTEGYVEWDPVLEKWVSHVLTGRWAGTIRYLEPTD